MELSKEVINRYETWASGPFTTEVEKAELQNTFHSNPKDIYEAFYTDLEFGTGGIRSLLGIGPNRMNEHSIKRATQAFANALTSTFNKDIAVCIGFDSRNFSKEFSKTAASVLASNGIKVFLFDHIVATPILSYAVRYHKAQGGIMITASHNPREYNGYKVYWEDGCQVTPPNDEKIISEYNKLTDYSALPRNQFETFLAEGMIEIPGEECENSYYELLKKECLNLSLCEEKGSDVSIVYTPLHGVGGHFIPRGLKNIGFTNIHNVSEQIEPDGDFPTVSPPNPEEREALTLAIQLMKDTNSDIAMATDPDADRLGVVVNHKGSAELLNGNQIGTLFLDYLASHKTISDKSLFIKTIVTTPLQEKVANHYGLKTINTLTGFKWICGVLHQMEQEGKDFDLIFATEESYGYLSHSFARDKDAINACSLMAEMTLFYKEKGMTLIDAIEDIYKKYGFSQETLIAKHYLGSEGKNKIASIVDYFRNYSNPDINGVKILEKTDILNGHTIGENGEKTLIDLPKSNVIGLKLEGDSYLWLRPSGTEPKIKFYIMVQSKGATLEESRSLSSTITDKISKFIEDACKKA